MLIGPSNALPALRERVDSEAELHTFSETQALEALDHIIRNKPRIVAIDQLFSSSSRGTAFINRIKDDPSRTECGVRAIAHDPALNRLSAVHRAANGNGTAVAVDEPKSGLDQCGTRRAQRIRIRDGAEVLVDGNAATLVDVSTAGAQVLCSSVLRPNQRVRLTFSDHNRIIRCHGSIAWASLERPKGLPPRYRAGIDMSGVDPDA